METISETALRSHHFSYPVSQRVRRRRVLSEARARSFEIRRRIRERRWDAAFVKSYTTESDQRGRTSSSSAKPSEWQEAIGKEDRRVEIKAVMGCSSNVRRWSEPARFCVDIATHKFKERAPRAKPLDIDEPMVNIC